MPLPFTPSMPGKSKGKKGQAKADGPGTIELINRTYRKHQFSPVQSLSCNISIKLLCPGTGPIWMRVVLWKIGRRHVQPQLRSSANPPLNGPRNNLYLYLFSRLIRSGFLGSISKGERGDSIPYINRAAILEFLNQFESKRGVRSSWWYSKICSDLTRN